jgi:hypothetical protein
MLCEVMVLAEDHLRLYRGSKIDERTGQPKVYTPYETLEDMGAYAKLADSVFHDIEVSLKEEMRPAQVRNYPMDPSTSCELSAFHRKVSATCHLIFRAGITRSCSAR